MPARFQHGTVLYNSARGSLAPKDLAGKRIGVRSYSQTTAGWVRGILQNDYVIRADKGKDITKMLIDGELDAAIYGAAMPDDPRLKSVVANSDEEAKAWYAKHHLVPVNHMVVVTDEFAQAKPEAVAELYRLLEAGRAAAGGAKGGIDTTPFGKEANRPCLELLIFYCLQQRLIGRQLSVDELW
jgi:4,5-dihydroxyphthalate decarboxylase